MISSQSEVIFSIAGSVGIKSASRCLLHLKIPFVGEDVHEELILTVKSSVVWVTHFFCSFLPPSEWGGNDTTECASLEPQTRRQVAEGRGLLWLRGPAVQQAPAGRHQPARPQRVWPPLTTAGAQGAGGHQAANGVHPQTPETEPGRAGGAGSPLRRPLSYRLRKQFGLAV